MTSAIDRTKFEAPAGGAWELEATHFTKPAAKITAELYPAPFAKGFSEGTAKFGLMLSHFEMCVVNGFIYQKPIIFAAPPNAIKPPPRPVFFLLTRLHPGIRKRLRAGASALEKKLWREDFALWQSQVKPASIAKHKALQSVDPASLDEAGLLKHLNECRDNLVAMYYQHHRFTISCIIAVGDFIAHVQDWTGKSPGEILSLLKGSSPVSRGVACGELDALAAAIKNDPDARALLDSTRPAREVIDGLRAHAGAVGEAARAYVDTVGYRALGYEVTEPFALELPETLVRAISVQLAGSGTGDARDGARGERLAKLRDEVPEAHRARFDELLREAREINPLRDERGHYSDAWGTGLMRRAMLEAGRRLVARGALDEAELAVDAGYDELLGLLRGERPVDSAALRERATWRKTKTTADAPPFLNAQPAPPPPTDWLPEIGRRAQRATAAVISNMFYEPEKGTATATTVRGLPVSEGVYEGTARLVRGEQDFAKIQQGDVLITRATSPYFNVVLPMLGGIVTDRGGQLSHAAIVAREYGIPSVVGTGEATKVIRDGARVRVDGTRGEVTVLDSPSGPH